MPKKLIKEGINALREQFNAASIARGAKKFSKSPDAFFGKRMPKKPQVAVGNPMFSREVVRDMENYYKSKGLGNGLYMSTPDDPREFRPNSEFEKIAKGEVNPSNVNDSPNIFRTARTDFSNRAKDLIKDREKYRLNPLGSPILADNPIIPNPEAASDRYKSGVGRSGLPGVGAGGAPDYIHGSDKSDAGYRKRLDRIYTDPGMIGAYDALSSLTRKVDGNPNTKPGTGLNPLDMQKAKGSTDLLRSAFKSLNKRQF